MTKHRASNAYKQPNTKNKLSQPLQYVNTLADTCPMIPDIKNPVLINPITVTLLEGGNISPAYVKATGENVEAVAPCRHRSSSSIAKESVKKVSPVARAKPIKPATITRFRPRRVDNGPYIKQPIAKKAEKAVPAHAAVLVDTLNS